MPTSRLLPPGRRGQVTGELNKMSADILGGTSVGAHGHTGRALLPPSCCLEYTRWCGPVQALDFKVMPQARVMSPATHGPGWQGTDCCCSVTKLCSTLCNPMGYSTPGFPVLHHLLESAQIHVHCISDAIQPSQSLSHPPTTFFFCPQSSPQSFSNESALCIRWPKYWNFSISPSNEYPG